MTLNPRTHAEAALIPWPILARIESDRMRAATGQQTKATYRREADAAAIARRSRIMAMLPAKRGDIATALDLHPDDVDNDLQHMRRKGLVKSDRRTCPAIWRVV